MNNPPLISCVIPIKNRHHLIGETIQSIVAQTYSNWEMIIVDDHSDDIEDLKKIIADLADDRIRLVELGLNGAGVSAARNMGNMLAQGDYIAVMDSDDIAYPERFEQSMAAVNDTGAGIVYGDIDWWDADADKVWRRDATNSQYYSRPFDLNQLREVNYIPHMTVMYKRAIAYDFPYNSFLRRGEDWDMLLRAARYGVTIEYVGTVMGKVRRHEQSIIRQDLSEFDYDQMVKENNKKTD